MAERLRHDVLPWYEMLDASEPSAGPDLPLLPKGTDWPPPLTWREVPALGLLVGFEALMVWGGWSMHEELASARAAGRAAELPWPALLLDWLFGPWAVLMPTLLCAATVGGSALYLTCVMAGASPRARRRQTGAAPPDN